jgi:hypothetical protein
VSDQNLNKKEKIIDNKWAVKIAFQGIDTFFVALNLNGDHWALVVLKIAKNFFNIQIQTKENKLILPCVELKNIMRILMAAIFTDN